MKELRTERLIIRPWRIEDLDDFYEYARDDRVGPNAGWPVHKNKAYSRTILESFIKDEEVNAIVLKEKNKVIGSIGLHKMRNQRDVQDEQIKEIKEIKEIGYVISPYYWGNGYAPEAVRTVLRYGFEVLHLERTWCTHFDFNERSKRVIEKCHFRYIKTEKRKLSLLGDEVVNTHCYSLTKEEYYKSEMAKLAYKMKV